MPDKWAHGNRNEYSYFYSHGLQYRSLSKGIFIQFWSFLETNNCLFFEKQMSRRSKIRDLFFIWTYRIATATVGKEYYYIRIDCFHLYLYLRSTEHLHFLRRLFRTVTGYKYLYITWISWSLWWRRTNQIDRYPFFDWACLLDHKLRNNQIIRPIGWLRRPLFWRWRFNID